MARKRQRLSDEEWIAKHARTVQIKRKRPRKAPVKAVKRKRPRKAPVKAVKRKRPRKAPVKAVKRVKPRNRRRLPRPPTRVPFSTPHTTLRVRTEEGDRLGYYVVIHGVVQGGWESFSTPVFYEEADTAQYHVIIWRTKVRPSIQLAMESFLELLNIEAGTGKDEQRVFEILWCELVALYPDHVHVRLDKWIGDGFPHYDFLGGG